MSPPNRNDYADIRQPQCHHEHGKGARAIARYGRIAATFTCAQVVEASGLDAKTVRNAIRCMVDGKYIIRISPGVFRMRGIV